MTDCTERHTAAPHNDIAGEGIREAQL